MSNKQQATVSETYVKELEKKLDDMKRLFGLLPAISSALELDELMPLVMEKAKKIMDAEACSILLYNEDTKTLDFEVAINNDESVSEILKKSITLETGQGIAGWVAANWQALSIEDVREDPRFFKGVDRLTGFTTRNMIAMPLMTRSGLLGVVQIINYNNDDLDPESFQLLCGQFAIAIENARFHKSAIEQERHKQQLEIAASLQKSFLPESPVFSRGRAVVEALNISASQVGGDVYDFVEPVDGKVGIFIGDVSGKGISAALYMAKFISDFRYISRQVESPEIVFNKLNDLASRAPMGMFVTAIYGILDLATGEILVSVAGHPPLIHLTREGAMVTELPAGPPLGIVPTSYPVSSVNLGGGERLFFLTDGVFEARDKGGEMLGFGRVVDFVNEHRSNDLTVGKLAGHVEKFSKGADQADDLTIVEVRWGASEGKP
ncbi:MAG: SpoIIE family protein phosphatase [Nitrospirota bacterium]|nr:SpoIIE family protein phosphatase [Nitrospirota bacterium]